MILGLSDFTELSLGYLGSIGYYENLYEFTQRAEKIMADGFFSLIDEPKFLSNSFDFIHIK